MSMKVTRVDALEAQLSGALVRLSRIHHRIERGAGTSDPLFPRVVSELEHSLHELEASCEMLREQVEQLEIARAEVAGERDRWRMMFDLAPVPYLLTDQGAVIQDANVAAARLLSGATRVVPHKPLSIFVNGKRAEFLARVHEGVAQNSFEIAFELRPRERAPVSVEALVHRFKLPDERDGLWWVFR